MTVKEYIQKTLEEHQQEVVRLLHLLNDLPEEVAELESDHIWVYGGWLNLKDTSHKDLGAKIASILDETAIFKTCGQIRTAVFYNLGPFYKVDLDRPNTKCRKVRVLRPAEELEMSICGDIPDGYELLEELDVPA